MKRIKKILLTVLLFVTVLALSGCNKKLFNTKKYQIITSNFAAYDFARGVIKDTDDVNLKLLIKPGSESHSFEPSPKDIIDIKNSDLFIYVGGESDEWINKLLKDLDKSKTKVIKLMDIVELYEEEHVEGMDVDHDHHHDHEDHEHVDHDHEHEDEEYDEHVWTNPKNAMKIVKTISDEIIKMDSKNKDKYLKNTKNYLDELEKIDQEIKNIVKDSKRKTLVFADRFPFRYFVEEYDLKYYAAFPGCSSKTEANPKTIAFLIEKVKKENIPYVFKIELSNEKIANTISKEANVGILEFHSAHNVSKDDFEKGITYIDIMKNNLKNLEKALN